MFGNMEEVSVFPPGVLSFVGKTFIVHFFTGWLSILNFLQASYPTVGRTMCIFKPNSNNSTVLLSCWERGFVFIQNNRVVNPIASRNEDCCEKLSSKTSWQISLAQVV